MNTIKANTTYYTRSIGDHNCIFSCKVLSRTAKMARILYEGKERRAKIYIDDNNREYIQPDHWSFAPSFRADETVRPKCDWEK